MTPDADEVAAIEADDRPAISNPADSRAGQTILMHLIIFRASWSPTGRST
jgi:hypothetical protein